MSDPVEQFFAGYPPDIQQISRILRQIVKEALPDAEEVLFASQNHVGYSFNNDKLCYICPLKNYVRLGFMYGAHLPDPDHLLIGEGKQLRHIKVKTPEEADNPAFKSLVESAALDRKSKKKP